MRVLSFVLGGAVLAFAPTAWAQTSADSTLHGSAAGRYGPSEELFGIAPGTNLAQMTDANQRGFFDPNSQRFISPVDPRYSQNEPPHRGQASAHELNGDDGGYGTVYPQIFSKDSGG